MRASIQYVYELIRTSWISLKEKAMIYQHLILCMDFQALSQMIVGVCVQAGGKRRFLKVKHRVLSSLQLMPKH